MAISKPADGDTSWGDEVRAVIDVVNAVAPDGTVPTSMASLAARVAALETAAGVLLPSSGAVATYDAGTIIGVNGGAVTTWPDSTGSASLTVTGGPTLVTSGPNGKPYVSFDGANDYAESTSLTVATGTTEVVVLRLRSTSPGAPVNGSTAARAVISYEGNWGAFAGNPVKGGRVIVNNQWTVVFVNYGTSGMVRANGTAASGSTGTAARGGLRFGRDEGTSNSYAATDIAYFRAWNRTLSSQEILASEAALASYFGIAL